MLTFYQPVSLDPPAPGRADPVVDLGDAEHGTIDRSLWMALLGPKGAAHDDVRRALASQTLSIGVYPAAQVPGQVIPPTSTATGAIDPGVVVEIAAPQPDPADPTAATGLGIGPAAYSRLPLTYADPVLEAPGLLQVTLPTYEKLLLWDFDPEEEGTGDFPPRVDDAAVASRIVTWIRLRYPPLADEQSAPVLAAPVESAGGTGTATSGAAAVAAAARPPPRPLRPDPRAGSPRPVSAPPDPDLSTAGCGCCCGDADQAPVGQTPPPRPARSPGSASTPPGSCRRWRCGRRPSGWRRVPRSTPSRSPTRPW